MTNDSEIDAYKSKAIGIGFGCAILLLGLLLLKFLMGGDYNYMGLILCGLLGIAAVLALNQHYWILCPVFVALGVKIPGLPFDGTELGCLAVTAIHFIRTALHKDQPAHLDARVLIAFPLILWIGLVWILNPPGLAIFGGTTIGARFYIKVALGFFAMMTLSTQRITETGSKHLFHALAVTMVIAAILRAVVPENPENETVDWSVWDPDAYTHYALLGILPLYFLLFAKNDIVKVSFSPHKILLAAAIGVCILVSGKRSAVASLILVPYYRTFLSRRGWIAALIATLVGIFGLIIVVAGDGTAYQLPNSAKRALAMVVPKYKDKGLEGMNDTFRETMREEARQIVRQNPIFGRKGYRMDFNETAWLASRQYTYAGHVLSGSWHSALYSYPADFGIPGMVFWLLFFAKAIHFSIQSCKRTREGSYHSACTLYYSCLILHSLVLIYTSGHSSISTQELCIRYGMLMALANGYEGVEFNNSHSKTPTPTA